MLATGLESSPLVLLAEVLFVIPAVFFVAFALKMAFFGIARSVADAEFYEDAAMLEALARCTPLITFGLVLAWVYIRLLLSGGGNWSSYIPASLGVVLVVIGLALAIYDMRAVAVRKRSIPGFEVKPITGNLPVPLKEKEINHG